VGGSGRKTLMSLAGVYLVYVGGKLFLDAMREKPGNYIFMMIMGIIFVVCGVGTVVLYMRGTFKHEKIEEEPEMNDEAEDLKENGEDDRDGQMERKPAAIVNLTEPAAGGPETSEQAGQDKPEQVKAEADKAEDSAAGMDDGVRQNEENTDETNTDSTEEETESEEDAEETEHKSE